MIPPILQIGNILISSDIITEEFCCDLEICHGACCVEGDAGAPVTLDEVMQIEERLDEVWGELSASAQAVIDRQGVAYTDRDGDLVTSIVGGKDCVFTCYAPLSPTSDGEPDGEACCLCALERLAQRKAQKSHLSTDNGQWTKPISCALYPIREKTFSDGTVGLNYHRWDVCESARKKGRSLHLPLYRFLKGPLTRRFGSQWYDELCDVANVICPSMPPHSGSS